MASTSHATGSAPSSSGAALPTSIAIPGWTMWSSTMRKNPNLVELETLASAAEVSRALCLAHPVTELPEKSYLHLFKAGIQPLWEDAHNAQGGYLKLEATSRIQANIMWLTVAHHFAAGDFPHHDAMNGVSVMANGDGVLKVWLAVDDPAVTQAIRQFLKDVLDARDYRPRVGFVQHKVVVKGASKRLPTVGLRPPSPPSTPGFMPATRRAGLASSGGDDSAASETSAVQATEDIAASSMAFLSPHAQPSASERSEASSEPGVISDASTASSDGAETTPSVAGSDEASSLAPLTHPDAGDCRPHIGFVKHKVVTKGCSKQSLPSAGLRPSSPLPAPSTPTPAFVSVGRRAGLVSSGGNDSVASETNAVQAMEDTAVSSTASLLPSQVQQSACERCEASSEPGVMSNASTASSDGAETTPSVPGSEEASSTPFHLHYVHNPYSLTVLYSYFPLRELPL